MNNFIAKVLLNQTKFSKNFQCASCYLEYLISQDKACSKMAANAGKTTVNPLDLKDCPVDTSLG